MPPDKTCAQEEPCHIDLPPGDHDQILQDRLNQEPICPETYASRGNENFICLSCGMLTFTFICESFAEGGTTYKVTHSQQRKRSHLPTRARLNTYSRKYLAAKIRACLNDRVPATSPPQLPPDDTTQGRWQQPSGFDP